MKRCTCCGRTHTRADWEALPLVGIQLLDPGEPPLELRNCLCRTTLAVELDVPLDTATPCIP